MLCNKYLKPRKAVKDKRCHRRRWSCERGRGDYMRRS